MAQHWSYLPISRSVIFGEKFLCHCVIIGLILTTFLIANKLKSKTIYIHIYIYTFIHIYLYVLYIHVYMEYPISCMTCKAGEMRYLQFLMLWKTTKVYINWNLYMQKRFQCSSSLWQVSNTHQEVMSISWIYNHFAHILLSGPCQRRWDQLTNIGQGVELVRSFTYKGCC